MPIPLLAAAGASAGLDILSGLFSYLGSEDSGAIADSRGRMIRMEAEADAERYSEQADQFKAKQKLSYLKSGVELSGSPLDILDETARTARENISAIRAGGDARAFDAEMQGVQARSQGRAALLGGIFGAGKTALMASYQSGQNAKTAVTPRNDTSYGGGSKAGR